MLRWLSRLNGRLMLLDHEPTNLHLVSLRMSDRPPQDVTRKILPIMAMPVVRTSKHYKGPNALSGTVVRQKDFDVTIGQCVVSDRNLATLFSSDRGHCPTMKSKSGCFLSNCMLCPTVVRQTDFRRLLRTVCCVL